MAKNKPAYIRTIEASSIYTHIVREEEIKAKYTGMIPFSLELIQLRKQKGFKESISKRNIDKLLSDSVVNLKFKYGVSSGKDKIKSLNKKLKKMEEDLAKANKTEKEKLESAIKNTKEHIGQIKAEASLDKWNGMSIDELRHYFYSNGFTLIDDEGNSQKFVVYKRSSAKSRTGECLFILEELYEDMINWSRLNLPFVKGKKIDLPSLLSYESLVGSALERTIEIDPNSILLVEDVDSKFKKKLNLIETVDEKLSSTKKEVIVKNSIWDGQSLLCSSFYEEGVSMMLLRNKFFKSAAFNTNIQKFLEDNCPKDKNYDEWYLEDMFGNKILAKDVKMITTPNSLKILKFASDVGMTGKEIYKHWRTNVGTWGICKTEKKSKRGENEQGMPLQQMSYQMINSLPASKGDIYRLTEIERNYIDTLKNDNEAYIKFLDETKDYRNSNEMYIALYNHNSDISKTAFFKEYKATKINAYVQRVKKGKVRIVGDYLVLFGNPYEFLLHAIGQFKQVVSHTLKDNEVSTTLFNPGEKLASFRNPHSSASNVLVAENVSNELINEYFNLSKNIVAVNSIGFELPDIYSGSDYDSDSVLCTNDKTILKLAKKCVKYKACINGVGADKTEYNLSNEDMGVIDGKLSQSQYLIGTVVNLGQLANSIYWDLLSQGREKEAKKVMEKVDVVTILSGLTIDAAKKLYQVNVRKEISNIQEFLKQFMPTEEDNKKTTVYKPLFFKNIDKNVKCDEEEGKKKVVKYKAYNTPMDYLGEIISKLPYGVKTETVNIDKLLNETKVEKKKNDTNYKQYGKLGKIAGEFINKINELNMEEQNEEYYREMDDVVKEFNNKIKKFNVKPGTMFTIVSKMLKDNKRATKKEEKDLSEVKNSRLLNSLYKSQPETFVNCFR